MSGLPTKLMTKCNAVKPRAQRIRHNLRFIKYSRLAYRTVTDVTHAASSSEKLSEEIRIISRI